MSENIEILEEDEVTYNYVRLTSKETKEVALGIVEGRLFASWMIREQDNHLMMSIFTPLVFLSEVQQKQMQINKIAHVYGDTSKATTALNGYPIMTQFKCLDSEDSIRISEQIQALIKLRDNFINA